jgi:hypothetical protein
MSKPPIIKEIPKPVGGSKGASILTMLRGATVSTSATQSTVTEREGGEETGAGDDAGDSEGKPRSEARQNKILSQLKP